MPEDKIIILLVEDNSITAKLEKMELEKAGYIVYLAETGEKAIESVLQKNLPADLILMDIDLGEGIDGTEAAEKILACKDMPVVFLSTHTDPAVVEKTEKITSYGYAVKNTGVVVLDASIKMALKLFNANRQRQIIEDVLQDSNSCGYNS
jgi:CheY-like chemotaxis protein